MAHSNRDNTLRITLSSMLLAIMLVLGYVESLLPSPGIPGIKLGLSNSILIFAVWMLDIPTAYVLMALKVLLSGLMFGGVSTMLYAFSGGLLSLTGMVLLKRIPSIHPIVVSMAGGLLHNTGQVVMAMLILHTPRQMLGYLGVLMLVGLACGALTGVAASAVMRHLRAVSWRAPKAASRGILPVILAVLLIAGGFYLAWREMNHVKTAEVIITTESNVPITDAGQPPF
ncbi:MAG: Gx transporter family protein [Clostridia bacterium]|nr:Gx transporter family protein [Clostridia bacterium]